MIKDDRRSKELGRIGGVFIEEGRNGKEGEDRGMEKKKVDTSWGRYLPYLASSHRESDSRG